MLAHLDIGEAARAELVGKMLRALERDHLAAGADELREVGRYESRAGADVDDGLTRPDFGPAERLEHPPAPDPVLQPETLDLIIARAQDVIAVAHAEMLGVIHDS